MQTKTPRTGLRLRTGRGLLEVNAEPGRSSRAFNTGLVTAIALLAGLIFVVVNGLPASAGIAWPWNANDTLKIQLASSDVLAPRADVEIAGVKVGEVQSISPQGDQALVTIGIEPKYFDIHSDARIALRPHGLFGPKYIDLTPGTPKAPRLSSGQTISITQTAQPVDLDQILQALQQPEQQNLKTFLVEFGKAAAGRGDDVNHLIVAADQLTQTLQTPLQALDQVSPNLSDMLVNDESFNAAFVHTPLDQLVANNNKTLEVLAQNSAHLTSLVDHADSVLTQLDQGLNGDAANIKGILDQAPQAISQLTTFNNLIGTFGADLTGKDNNPQLTNNSSVVNGIIAAIKNPESAFSSWDPCQEPSDPNSLGQNHCPGANLPMAGQQHYLRVQVFNFGGSNGFPICRIMQMIAQNPPNPNLSTQPTCTASSGSSASTASMEVDGELLWLDGALTA